jgi:hypothetical protein
VSEWGTLFFFSDSKPALLEFRLMLKVSTSGELRRDMVAQCLHTKALPSSRGGLGVNYIEKREKLEDYQDIYLPLKARDGIEFICGRS